MTQTQITSIWVSIAATYFVYLSSSLITHICIDTCRRLKRIRSNLESLLIIYVAILVFSSWVHWRQMGLWGIWTIRRHRRGYRKKIFTRYCFWANLSSCSCKISFEVCLMLVSFQSLFGKRKEKGSACSCFVTCCITLDQNFLVQALYLTFFAWFWYHWAIISSGDWWLCFLC